MSSAKPDRDNDVIKFPEGIADISPAPELPNIRHRWNTNEEIASYLVTFHKHKEWQKDQLVTRPVSGSLLMYSRKKVRYRQDGYCWKRRNNAKHTIREDHMKLKVRGVECLYGSYVHSSILSTFHRRSYWLLHNPDVVLVHYLNVPFPDSTKLTIPSLSASHHDDGCWTKERLIAELRPIFHTSSEDNQATANSEQLVQSIAAHLIAQQDNKAPQSNICIRSIPAAVAGVTTDYVIVSCAHNHKTNMTVTRGSQAIRPAICHESRLQLRELSVAEGSMKDMIMQPINHVSLAKINPGDKRGTYHAVNREIQALRNCSNCDCNAQGCAVQTMNEESHPGDIVNHESSVYCPDSQTMYKLSTLESLPFVVNPSNLSIVNHDPIDRSPPSSVLKDVNLLTNSANLSLHDLEKLAFSDIEKFCPDVAPYAFNPQPSSSSDYQPLPQHANSDLAFDWRLNSDTNIGSMPLESMFTLNRLTGIDEFRSKHAMNEDSNNGSHCMTHQNANMNQFTCTSKSSVKSESFPQSNMYDFDRNVEMNSLPCSNLGQSDKFCLHNTQNELNANRSSCNNHTNIVSSTADKLSYLNSSTDLITSDHTFGMKCTNRNDKKFLEIVNSLKSSHSINDMQSCDDNYISNELMKQCNTYFVPICDHSTAVPSTDQHPSVINISQITDFSPDWSVPEGGSKVLVTGPWQASDVTYQCLFGDVTVPACLIQKGVLRCYTPGHSCGQVCLCVMADGHITSQPVMFEYRKLEPRHLNMPDFDWFSLDDSQLLMMMVERFLQIERRLSPSKTNLSAISPHSEGMDHKSEESFVEIVRTLSGRFWSPNYDFPRTGLGRITILHMAAALGFSKLISALFTWKCTSPNVMLELEVDIHATDSYSCTPLMWACARGQIEAASLLYHQHQPTLHFPNKDGLVPLLAARQRGHSELAAHLDHLDHTALDSKDPFLSPIKIVASNASLSSNDVPMTSSPNVPRFHHDVAKDDHPAVTYPLLNEPSPSSRKLSKRFSMDAFPDSALPSLPTIRVASSEPDLAASLTDLAESLNESKPRPTSCDRSLLYDPNKPEFIFASPFSSYLREPECTAVITPAFTLEDSDTCAVAMDTDDVEPCRSPLIDVERTSDDDNDGMLAARQAVQGAGSVSEKQMVTLANQIIAAMPERIKLSPCRSDDDTPDNLFSRARSESYSSVTSQFSPLASSYGDDSGISTPMYDSLCYDDSRHIELVAPLAATKSPDVGALVMPYSTYGFMFDSTPPTAADFNEYFNAPTTYMEKDFSQLTLSDYEQRKLYEAAKVIQNAYRVYRDRQQQEQKEIEAAILIQTYYRRYKEYLYHKKKCQAAVLIQSQFRSYYAQKRYKRSRDAAVVIQTQYRHYREHERVKRSRNNAAAIIQQRFRKHYQRKSKAEIASSLLQLASDTNDSIISQDPM